MKSIGQQNPLYMVFISAPSIENYFENYFVKIICEFHDGMQRTVLNDGDTIEVFPVCYVVKQGCMLAPILFGLYLAAVLETTSENLAGVQHGVYHRSGTDGKLFNPACSHAISLCR